MASIGWIDFSPADKNRVGTILDLLKPEGMVDELGLGTIRDSISNELFPGISTIQTRAKYFFIIPYILREYQAMTPVQRRKKPPGKFLENREYEIMWELADLYEHKDGEGVIGITKYKPDKIIRRPSTIYWTGLSTYQFIDAHGLSMENYFGHLANSSLESLLSTNIQEDDGNSDDIDAGYDDLFGIKVPNKSRWSEGLTLDLQKEEAEFFEDRIISISKNKLIAKLLINKQLWQIFKSAENFMDFAKAAVQVNLSSRRMLSKDLEASLILAHDFSELMHGAHIAYNCQLHKKVFNSNYFDNDWNEWLQNIQNTMLDYQNFNPELLTDYTLRTRQVTVQFIRNWWQETQTKFLSLEKRDELIQSQEAIVKGNKARLRWDKTDDVKEKKWLGLRYFDYRFYQAETILEDIKTGLKN